MNSARSTDEEMFLERGHARRVLKETFSVNDTLLFSRAAGLEIGDMSVVESFLMPAYGQYARGAAALAAGSLHDEELFLVNGFKTIFSSRLVSMVTGWLEKSFTIIYRCDSMRLVPQLPEGRKGSAYIEKTRMRQLRCLG